MMPAFNARTALNLPKQSDCLHSAVCIGYPAGISSPYRSLVQAEYFHDFPAHTSPLLPHPMSAPESCVGFHLFGLLNFDPWTGRVTYLFLAGSSLRQERETDQVLVEITWRLQLVATSYRYWGQLGSPHFILHAPWTLCHAHRTSHLYQHLLRTKPDYFPRVTDFFSQVDESSWSSRLFRW